MKIFLLLYLLDKLNENIEKLVFYTDKDLNTELFKKKYEQFLLKGG